MKKIKTNAEEWQCKTLGNLQKILFYNLSSWLTILTNMRAHKNIFKWFNKSWMILKIQYWASNRACSWFSPLNSPWKKTIQNMCNHFSIISWAKYLITSFNNAHYCKIVQIFSWRKVFAKWLQRWHLFYKNLLNSFAEQ